MGGAAIGMRTPAGAETARAAAPPPGADAHADGRGDGRGDGDTDGRALRTALAALAARLLAIDPAALGGVLLHAPGTEESARWLQAARAACATGAPGAPWRRLPVAISEDRLLGGLDVAATLASGARVTARGLLADGDGGVLVLGRAGDAGARVVSALAGALDDGAVALERDGLSERHAARIAVVAVAHGDEREAVAPALAERLALHVALPVGWSADDTPGAWGDAADPAADVAAARARLAAVALPRAAAAALCEAADALGVDSPRAAVLAGRVARASAALDGRAAADADDLARAVRLVLAPRATRVPELETPDEPNEPQPPPPDDAPPPDPAPEPPRAERPAEPPPDHRDPEDAPPDADPPAPDLGDLGELLIAAAQAALPPDLLAGRSTGAAPRQAPREAGGRRGDERRDDARGRRVGTRAGRPVRGARLDVVETLRTAAPWQGLRRAARPATRPLPTPPADRRHAPLAHAGTVPEPRAPLDVRGEDLRVQRRRRRTGTTTLFVVDASGSAALGRLAEAKGAVELLLAESYVRRDRVGLIAFRGRGAELLLPPTRALTRARRALGALPAGGGTPLAAALVSAGEAVDLVRREGARAAVVLLTDGRANVALDGAPGRPRAREDAHAAARALRLRGALTIVVDVAPRGDPEARALAATLDARYVVLPVVTARALHARVRDAVAGAEPAGGRRA